MPADFTEIIVERRSRRSIERAPLREVVNCLSFATSPSFKWSVGGSYERIDLCTPPVVFIQWKSPWLQATGGIAYLD